MDEEEDWKSRRGDLELAKPSGPAAGNDVESRAV